MCVKIYMSCLNGAAISSHIIQHAAMWSPVYLHFVPSSKQQFGMNVYVALTVSSE